MPRPEDKSLVAGLLAGDADARTRFYRQYHRDVLGWCRRLGGGLVDPEDAAHDVFEVALHRVVTFRGDSSLARWLFGLTRKVLANHRRRARTRRLREWLTDTPARSASSPTRDPLKKMLDGELLRSLHVAIGSLTRKQREVLVLCAIEERSGGEVADILGVSRATVYNRLHSARRAFARHSRGSGLVRPRNASARGEESAEGEELE